MYVYPVGTVRQGGSEEEPLEERLGSFDDEPCSFQILGGKKIYYFWTCPTDGAGERTPTVYNCQESGCTVCESSPHAVFNDSQCNAYVNDRGTANSGGATGKISTRFECGDDIARPTYPPWLSGPLPSSFFVPSPAPASSSGTKLYARLALALGGSCAAIILLLPAAAAAAAAAAGL